MHARLQSALLWGLVGGMAFVVLAQGTIAIDAVDVGLTAAVAGGFLVAIATALVAYRYEHRVAAWAETRRR